MSALIRRASARSLSFLLFLAVTMACVHPVSSQPIAANDPVSQAAAVVDRDEGELTALRKQVDPENSNDEQLTGIKAKVDEKVQELQQAVSSLKPRLEQVTKRLEELGEPPKDGEPNEAPEVSEERQKLQDERAKLNAVSGQAQDLATKGMDLSNSITAVRRQQFTDRLFEHTDISLDLVNQAISASSAEFHRFVALISGWAKTVWTSKKLPLAIALSMSLAVAHPVRYPAP